MNPRIALRLWLALALFGADALVWAIAVHPVNTAKASAATIASNAHTALPAVTLATITVHPDLNLDADDATADNFLDETVWPSRDPAMNAESIGDNLPRLPRVHLSLPYYSFGKLLPHVRKD